MATNDNSPVPSKNMQPAASSVNTTASRHVDLVGQEIGGCIILEKIAEGGMGTVFKAKHKALDRIVCVKVLSPALANDKKAVGLFLTEARAIAEIDHPNIVFVYNVGKEKNYHFIVMSFIEGESLSSIVRRRPNLPMSFIVDAFCGILQGLEAAHQKGIIHRDIKPSNILINKKLEPKIVDFGIAKKIDKEKGVAKTTELAGTAYFISPEQALGRPIDARTDLYALGASLFYVLTGKYPFTGKNSMDIIQKHINMPVPDILTYRSNIPPWLVIAVNKLMAKNPKDRFQSAQEAYLFFKKSREDEKLALNRGLNIAEEVGLNLSKADDTAQRDESNRAKKPPVRRYSSDISPLKKTPTVKSFIPMVDDNIRMKNAKSKVRSNILTNPSRSYLKTFNSFIKKSTLSVALVGLMLIISAAIFLKLGSAVSAFNLQTQAEGNSFVLLTKALISPHFVVQHTIIYSLAVIFFASLCIITFLKLVKRTVPIMVIIALLSYTIGVFDLTQSTAVISFTGKGSFIIYSLLCGALAIKLNEKPNLPLPFKIISTFLFILGFIFIYRFAEPFQSLSGPLSLNIFYVLFAASAASCVSLIFNTNSFVRLLTPILFFFALSAVFFYQISGSFYYLKDQLATQAFLPKITESRSQDIQGEEAFQEQLKNHEKALYITFDEEPQELLYKIHNSKNLDAQMVDSVLWRYSIKEPFNSLKDYRKNGEMMLIIVALILYGLLACIIDIFAYKEEKWNLI